MNYPMLEDEDERDMEDEGEQEEEEEEIEEDEVLDETDRGLEVRALARSWESPWEERTLLRRLYARLERAEAGLLAMRNFTATLEQLLFLALAEGLLPPHAAAAATSSSTRAGQPQQQQQQYQQSSTDCTLTRCLYSLVIYNAVAYCWSYARELCAKGASASDWSPYVTVAESSQVRHLALSATKIVLEWTKAVTFLMTLAFVLIIVSFEQAVQRYKPSLSYTIITWGYYLAMEKNFIDIFPAILTYMDIEALESLENLYAPVILRIFTIFLSALFVLIRLSSMSWCLILTATYINIFLRYKELMQTYWIALQKERILLSKYRNATLEEIKEFDDVCSVCLFPMKKARATPCQHLFHANCLLECIKTSDNCPLCKQKLVFA